MRKKLRIISAIALGVVMLGSVLLLPVVQLTNVWADTTTLTFNFNISNVEDAPVLEFDAYYQEGYTDNNLSVRVPGDDRPFSIDAFNGVNEAISFDRINVVCGSPQSCSLSVSGVDTSITSEGIHFSVSGDAPYALWYLNGDEPYNGENLLEDDSFVVRWREVAHFSGEAYAIWACGENDEEVCLHLFDNIQNENFETEYYAASEVTDIMDPSRTFDQFGAFEDEDYIRGMAEKTRVDEWVVEHYGEGKTVADVDWSEVNIHELFRGVDKGVYQWMLVEQGICIDDGDVDALHACVDQYFIDNDLHESRGVKLQPVGESQGNSSYVSYGDRNFRITIYGEDYKAIELGDLSDLYYIPLSYQDATYVDAIDISGTTKEAPAIMHSILLEDTVSIKAAEVGGLEIESIEALDVPEGAVDIEGNNNEYEFTFNSNFYDAVIFKITDTDENEYYLDVERSILDNWIREDRVQTTFYFDAETSYDDYELIATYVYNDGTMVEKNMVNAEEIDDGLLNMTYAPEAPAGTNLKMAVYKVDEEPGFSDELDGVYFNVRMKGSDQLVYAGTLTGSGFGVYESMSIYRH